jgi:hypothetical protein
MKRKFVAGLCVLALVGLTSYAVAEDLQPPEWRGEFSTTSQMWEFDTEPIAGDPILPDGPAPGGEPPLPSTNLIWTPGPDPWDEWLPEDEGRIGVVPLSGTLEVTVDNHNPPQ